MQVLAILFSSGIEMGIDDTFAVIFGQYSIPILLSSLALSPVNLRYIFTALIGARTKKRDTVCWQR